MVSTIANFAKSHLKSYNNKHQEFLNFVLKQYVKEGVSEPDIDKLPNLLTLKYKAVSDGVSEFSGVEMIRGTFIGF